MCVCLLHEKGAKESASKIVIKQEEDTMSGLPIYITFNAIIYYGGYIKWVIPFVATPRKKHFRRHKVYILLIDIKLFVDLGTSVKFSLASQICLIKIFGIENGSFPILQGLETGCKLPIVSWSIISRRACFSFGDTR